MAGGARPNSGPPPDPNALRASGRDAGRWTQLPPEGRKGSAPMWPLSPVASPREMTLWTREWRRPQAIEWERNGQEEEVALYVRTLAKAETLEATTQVRILVRQQQDALGISLPGMARQRWTIGPSTSSRVITGDRRKQSGSSSTSARARLRALDGGQA